MHPPVRARARSSRAPRAAAARARPSAPCRRRPARSLALLLPAPLSFPAKSSNARPGFGSSVPPIARLRALGPRASARRPLWGRRAPPAWAPSSPWRPPGRGPSSARAPGPPGRLILERGGPIWACLLARLERALGAPSAEGSGCHRCKDSLACARRPRPARLRRGTTSWGPRARIGAPGPSPFSRPRRAHFELGGRAGALRLCGRPLASLLPWVAEPRTRARFAPWRPPLNQPRHSAPGLRGHRQTTTSLRALSCCSRPPGGRVELADCASPLAVRRGGLRSAAGSGRGRAPDCWLWRAYTFERSCGGRGECMCHNGGRQRAAAPAARSQSSAAAANEGCVGRSGNSLRAEKGEPYIHAGRRERNGPQRGMLRCTTRAPGGAAMQGWAWARRQASDTQQHGQSDLGRFQFEEPRQPASKQGRVGCVGYSDPCLEGGSQREWGTSS
jgi:hypothetical protein